VCKGESRLVRTGSLGREIQVVKLDSIMCVLLICHPGIHWSYDMNYRSILKDGLSMPILLLSRAIKLGASADYSLALILIQEGTGAIWHT